MDKRKVIFYKDLLNDEFSVAQIKAKPVDENYVYIHKSRFKRFTRFFWYRIVATPIAFLYVKLKFCQTTVGKEKLKPYKKTGYYMYGNHTQDIGDAFLPNIINFPQSNYVIVHANNVSMPFLGRITPSLGALPLPDNMKAYKNFVAAVSLRIEQGNTVVIYPEAHIWPYYTKIRPFTDVSFTYPIQHNTPVFAFTNTYQARKHSKKPKIVTYIDGPFFPDEGLPKKERKQALRNEVYKAMCARAESSDKVMIQYIKEE